MKRNTSSRRSLSLFEGLEDRRLFSGGDLDSLFSGDGMANVTLANGVTIAAKDAAVQADGKVVVVGGSSNGEFALARFNSNGSIDTSFGAQGTGVVLSGNIAGRGNASAAAVAIDASGGIVVAGTAQSNFAVAHYSSSGVMDWADSSFEFDGALNSQAYSSASDVVIQKDGKIVVVGQVYLETTVPISPGYDNTDFAVARLNANGSLDGSFAGDGTQSIGLGQWEGAKAVTIDYNGSAATNPNYGKIIVVGGKGPENGSTQRLAVARLKTNGDEDGGFRGGGSFSTDFIAGFKYAQARGVVVMPDDGIVVTGPVSSDATAANFNFGLLGLKSDGNTNTNFGINGTVQTDFGGSDKAEEVIFSQTGDLIVGGSSGSKMALAAYDSTGKLDSHFSGDGRQTTTFASGGASALGLSRAPGGKIVAAGGAAFATARYIDVHPNVAVTSLDSVAHETPSFFATLSLARIIKLPPPEDPASFFVTRDMRLPYATRVYFTVGGTASNSQTAQNPDYNLDGMGLISPLVSSAPIATAAVTTSSNLAKIDTSLTGSTRVNTTFSTRLIPDFGPPITGYVDIPANQTYAVVTLRPVYDTIAEGAETATFTINKNTSYDTASPSQVTLSILDNGSNAVSLSPTADAFVQDGTAAGTNFGSANELRVKAGGSGFNRNGYLKFDLSSVNTINSVKLQLYGRLSDTQNTNLLTSLFSVADTTWSEGGITYNNKPATGASALASATIVDNTLRMYEFDVTAYVKAEKALGHNTVSFALKNASSSASYVIFNSREAASGQPKLSIA